MHFHSARDATPRGGPGASVATWRIVFRNRGLLLSTIFTVLVLIGQVVQSIHDFRNLEARTAGKIESLAGMARAIVKGQLVDVRQLLGVVDLWIADASEGDAIHLPNGAQLEELKELYQTFLPGVEILVLDKHRRFVAESDPDLRNSSIAILRIADRLRQDDGPTIALEATYNLQGNCIVVGKAYIDQSGRRRAFVIAMVPAGSITHAFSQLEPEYLPLVTLRNASGQLIDWFPGLPAATFGDTLPDLSKLAPGPVPGSHYELSPLDGLHWLTIERDIALPLANQRWTLGVGYAVRSYRQGWYVSTAINAAICAILVLSWAITLASRWHEVRLRRQVDESRQTMERLLADLPIPFILVTRTDRCIVHGNDALDELFGAMTTPGSPLSRLLVSDDDWPSLLRAGAKGTVGMVTRRGQSYMLVHCTGVTGLGRQSARCWLLTLVDVTEQHVRQKQLQTEAATDALTGLANRRAFTMAAELKVANARKPQSPLAVLSLDLDHFKRVNDQHGHGAGDLVLMEVARLLRDVMREGDLATRLGGEEFAVLLPDTTLRQAVAVAERIRQRVAGTPVVMADGCSLSVTVCVGAAQYHDSEFDLDPAIERADQALYRAKKGGRNRVESTAYVVPPKLAASESDAPDAADR